MTCNFDWLNPRWFQGNCKRSLHGVENVFVKSRIKSSSEIGLLATKEAVKKADNPCRRFIEILPCKYRTPMAINIAASLLGTTLIIHVSRSCCYRHCQEPQSSLTAHFSLLILFCLRGATSRDRSICLDEPWVLEGNGCAIVVSKVIHRGHPLAGK